MPCAANVREIKIAFGFKAQKDLVTKQPAPDLWSMTKTNPAMMAVELVSENDAADIGKGDEFPSQNFLTNWNVTVPFEKYMCSEFMAWLFAFSLGTTTETPAGTTGFKYVCVPQDPAVDCIDMRAFTYVEQVRPQPDSVIDRAAIGCVVNDWTVSLASGPGRANARVVANFVGTGSVDQPSGIIIPAIIQEHFLNAASATININGTDYVLSKTFVSADITWNNNVRLDEGFYPGSGTKNGAAIRGRMEHGDRTCGFTFRARMEQGSPELVKLMNQTTGAADISLTGALIEGTTYHGCKFHFPKVVFSFAQPEEQNGIITVNVTAQVLKDPAQPYVQFEATTVKAGILLPPSA